MNWHYVNNRGVRKAGTVERTSDHGGSDITYFLRGDDGQLDVVSGLHIKATNAHAVWGKCGDAATCELLKERR